MNNKGRIPVLFALYNAYITSTKDYLLAMGGGLTNWERLGLTGGQINMWIAFCNGWILQYAKYTNLDLRTKAVKDLMRQNQRDFKIFAQPVLRFISGSPNATVDDFETFNIKEGILRDTSPTAQHPPTTHPIITFIDMNEALQHTIHIKDELLSGWARPKGVGFCEVAFIVRPADSPPDSVDDCDLRFIAHKSISIIDFAVGSTGKRAFYFVRWVNKNGEAGPWSPMYHALIA